ncbi:MAG TPA: OB-fold domain-containing protein, partial [Jiangellaceae bacterium]|nr:OB-fold domain-containing protein [Jiangellaceae bacterium]
NRFFWTSGEDGRLRFQRCASCGTLRHPPALVCAECQSTDAEVVAVGGAATVVAVTVDHHPWHPDVPPPYAIAIVAVDEDPRVRLTTNVVGCPPDEVAIGMRVHVVFERHEDVWLPLFTPVAGAGLVATAPDPEIRDRVRPMARREKFEDHVALSGIGTSRIGRRLLVDPLSLTVDACRAAIADAGLDVGAIDGLCTYPGPDRYAGGHSEGGVTALENALRVHPTWFNGGPETPGQSGSVVAAMLAVAAGLCRHVLCYRTVWESTAATLPPPAGASKRVEGDMLSWRVPFGAMSAANWIALFASNHFHHYGTTREALGQIAITARRNAALNPDAVYREPITMDDYMSARMISTPFGLYDCDVPCDGAVAIIVSAADVADDLRAPPVHVEAVGTQIIERLSWDQGTLTHEPQLMGPAAHMWSRTDLRPTDVDVALLYDGFTFNCLSWLEAMGFCGRGEGAAFVEGGHRIALGGELPVNPHGGQLSAGRTHGYGFLHEAVLQLRGTAGDRQVEGAEVAAVTTGGGTPGGALLLTSARR